MYSSLIFFSFLQQSIASLDGELLLRACKGIGTDEAEVVRILCGRTKSHVELIDLKVR
jgi:hypothetical protein